MLQVIRSAELHMVLATQDMAKSACDAISLLERPVEALQCFQALCSSDMLTNPLPDAVDSAAIMPLVLLHESLQPVAGGVWLGDVLHRLLVVGHKFELRGSDMAAVYQDCFDLVFEGVMAHVGCVSRMWSEARKVGALNVEKSLEAMSVPHVLRVLLPECSAPQAKQWKAALQELVG